VRNLFTHIRRAVEASGGTPDNILKISFWMKEPGTGRAALNEEWVKMFPDPDARPARHTLALGAESNALVTCDFVAVFGQGKEKPSPTGRSATGPPLPHCGRGS
jgi:enamine deaminase RidA (YjgF/YER057c/UK114 family)